MLKLYENIKKRRIALNMSQQELAEAVGYSGKSMISQVEKGMIDISSTMISRFAEALKCTESFLMGWEDDIVELATAPKQDEMVNRAIEYYKRIQAASPEVRAAIETLLKASQSDSEHPQ